MILIWFQLKKRQLRYAVELVRPWWRFWRSERMWKDQADHEWTTWKISASQSTERKILEGNKYYLYFQSGFTWFYSLFSPG